MSVNLTARQLRHPDLVGQVARAIRQTGLPAPHLKLEITERTIVEDAEAEIGVLSQMRRMGVKLAIDDFGTGYSSLGYLRRWPVGTLKIDRSFIETIEHDAGARKLVAAMSGLGHALGADVTVEGIETAGQLTWLRGIGIERGQGFYFAPPLPADEFARLLTRDEAYDLTSVTDLGPLTMLRDTIAANDGRMAR
jgi:EAL domain-containing protein (putative c-di-GMP-specific phosphodiesterase class I)